MGFWSVRELSKPFFLFVPKVFIEISCMPKRGGSFWSLVTGGPK